jgi:hypothetical protein
MTHKWNFRSQQGKLRGSLQYNTQQPDQVMNALNTQEAMVPAIVNSFEQALQRVLQSVHTSPR